MLVSSLHEYGLRCAVQLARVSEKEPISASLVAEMENISVEYVSKIMLHFRKGGLVKSIRGKNGGFHLLRSPKDIFVKEVLQSLKNEGGRPEDILGFCRSFSPKTSPQKSPGEECVHSSCCSIRPLWEYLFQTYQNLIGSITLEDLSLGSEAVHIKLAHLGQKYPEGAQHLDQTRSKI